MDSGTTNLSGKNPRKPDIMNYNLDHVYCHPNDTTYIRNSAGTKDMVSIIKENQQLKAMLLLHLDLIQEQSDQLILKDRQIITLKQQNEQLTTKLDATAKRNSESMEKRIEQAKKINNKHQPLTVPLEIDKRMVTIDRKGKLNICRTTPVSIRLSPVNIIEHYEQTGRKMELKISPSIVPEIDQPPSNDSSQNNQSPEVISDLMESIVSEGNFDLNCDDNMSLLHDPSDPNKTNNVDLMLSPSIVIKTEPELAESDMGTIEIDVEIKQENLQTDFDEQPNISAERSESRQITDRSSKEKSPDGTHKLCDNVVVKIENLSVDKLDKIALNQFTPSPDAKEPEKIEKKKLRSRRKKVRVSDRADDMKRPSIVRRPTQYPPHSYITTNKHYLTREWIMDEMEEQANKEIQVMDEDGIADGDDLNLETPSWCIKECTALYVLEGTEDLRDEVFLKRHARFELDEKKRKKWDVQRIREQRTIERLKLRHCKKELQHDANIRSDINDLSSFYPSVDSIKTIEITDELPVVAFGEIIPKLQSTDFTLPWLHSDSHQKSIPSTSTIQNRRQSDNKIGGGQKSCIAMTVKRQIKRRFRNSAASLSATMAQQPTIGSAIQTVLSTVNSSVHKRSRSIKKMRLKRLAAAETLTPTNG